MKQIKIKSKECRIEGCSNMFQPFRSTDKYCSFKCAADNQKEAKPRAAIKKKSTKQATLDRAYLVLRKTFLLKPENKYCAVYRESLATEVHHKAGRVGKMYLYVPNWLAVSRIGHCWIHNNPEESYKKGFLIKSTTV